MVYHGTARSKPISIFKGGKSGYVGPGIYFTPEKRTASKYTGMYGDGLIDECFVNVRNPFAISYADKPAQVILDAVAEGAFEKRFEAQGNESQLLKKADLTKLRRKGYDGIVWAPKKALDEGSFQRGEMLLFESSQIKSATDNVGTYDAGNADITFSVKSVMTKLKEGLHNVLVAVQLDSEHSSLYKVKVNRLASMYGKEKIGALLTHTMLYWNKAKARPWLASYRLQLPAIIQPKRASGRKILKPADLVKYKEENSLSFSLSGRGMIDAADLGANAVVNHVRPLIQRMKREKE